MQQCSKCLKETSDCRQVTFWSGDERSPIWDQEPKPLCAECQKELKGQFRHTRTANLDHNTLAVTIDVTGTFEQSPQEKRDAKLMNLLKKYRDLFLFDPSGLDQEEHPKEQTHVGNQTPSCKTCRKNDRCRHYTATECGPTSKKYEPINQE